MRKMLYYNFFGETKCEVKRKNKHYFEIYTYMRFPYKFENDHVMYVIKRELIK